MDGGLTAGPGRERRLELLREQPAAAPYGGEVIVIDDPGGPPAKSIGGIGWHPVPLFCAGGDVFTATASGGLLGGLLPEDVAVAELFDAVDGVELFPQEADAVAAAVDKRRREFGAVRLCARRAMARLGVAPRPLAPDGRGPKWARRAPRWPEGFVGSMTHCAGYCGAAVARDSSVAALGVDAEPNEPVPEGVRELITLPEERSVLERLGAAHPDVHWDRLLFSAKESVYKAWFPLTERWLDFDQCAITPDPERGTFTAALKVTGPVVGGVRLDRFDGRWRVRNGLTVTAVAIPAPTSERAG